MKIEGVIQTKNAPSSKSQVETNPEEFSKALTKAICDGDDKIKIDGLNLEQDEENEGLEGKLPHMFTGLFALPMLERQDIDGLVLDADLGLREEIIPIDGASNTMVSLDNLVILDEMVAIKQRLNNEEALGSLKSIDINQPFNLDAKLESSLDLIDTGIDLEKDKYDFIGNPLPDDEVESPLTEETKLKHPVNDGTFTGREKNEIPIESNEINNSISMDELKQTKELEQATELDMPDGHLSIQEKSPIRDFKFNFIESESSPKPVLSNENLQNINDTILHLKESTIEGQANVLKVKLFPEDLGTVDITLSMESGKLTAKILVDNEHIKGMFANSINELSQGLAKENISVEKINIDLNLNSDLSKGQSFNMNQQGGFHNSKRFSSRNHIGIFNSASKEVISGESHIDHRGTISILA